MSFRKQSISMAWIERVCRHPYYRCILQGVSTIETARRWCPLQEGLKHCPWWRVWHHRNHEDPCELAPWGAAAGREPGSKGLRHRGFSQAESLHHSIRKRWWCAAFHRTDHYFSLETIRSLDSETVNEVHAVGLPLPVWEAPERWNPLKGQHNDNWGPPSYKRIINLQCGERD